MSKVADKKKMDEVITILRGLDKKVENISTQKGKKNKKLRDKDMPKRAQSAWIIFRNDRIKKYRDAHPSDSDTKEKLPEKFNMQNLSIEWDNLSEKDKKVYEDKAQIEKEKTKKAMEIYLKNKKNKETENNVIDDSDDSDENKKDKRSDGEKKSEKSEATKATKEKNKKKEEVKAEVKEKKKEEVKAEVKEKAKDKQSEEVKGKVTKEKAKDKKSDEVKKEIKKPDDDDEDDDIDLSGDKDE
jgi:hypothetical protein